MRTPGFKYVLMLMLIYFGNAFSQDFQINNYSFAHNYATGSVSSGQIIKASVGRSFVGISRSNKNSIKNNPFINDFVFLKLNTEDDLPNWLPMNFSLNQNYPNPFNPNTVIQFSIPEQSYVNLVVYNLLGEKVAILVDELKAPGSYNVIWQAGELSSGIYVYTLRSGDFFESKKLILLK